MSKPFTARTLDEFWQRGLSPAEHGAYGRDPLHWTAQADLEAEWRALDPSLDEKSVRALVAAACSGLPVNVTWAVNNTIMSATVLVTQLFPPSKGSRGLSHGTLHHRRWGFSGPIRLSQVLEARVPKTAYYDRKGDA
jgi:hypothetical protein